MICSPTRFQFIFLREFYGQILFKERDAMNIIYTILGIMLILAFTEFVKNIKK